MKYIKEVFATLSTILLFSACSSWTEPTAKQIDHIGGYNTLNDCKSDEYYANLRAWKATAENYGRPVSFGWFSNWSPTGVVRKGYLASLPDSIDMISMWSGPFNISEEKKADKTYVQKVKGTKIFVCYLLYNIGDGITPASVSEKVRQDNPDASDSEIKRKIAKATEAYWGYTSGQPGSKDHSEAIERYAQVLCDSIVKYDYDGFDIDWEPQNGGFGTGNLVGNNGEYLLHFIKALSKYLGPKATVNTGKRRYLLLDGEFGEVPKEAMAYLDYVVSQAYGQSYLGGRVSSLQYQFGEHYDIRKHIFTENFESYAITGGALLKQAAFMSTLGPKGGVGAYRLDNDYDNKPDYKWMRQAIQILHKTHAEQIKMPKPKDM